MGCLKFSAYLAGVNFQCGSWVGYHAKISAAWANMCFTNILNITIIKCLLYKHCSTHTCSMTICCLVHEKVESWVADPTDTRIIAPPTPRHSPRMPWLVKIVRRAPAMPPTCLCWCPTAISSFACDWRWVLTWDNNIKHTGLQHNHTEILLEWCTFRSS